MKRMARYIIFFILLSLSFLIGHFTNESKECEPEIVEKLVFVEKIVEKEVEKKMYDNSYTLCKYADIYRDVYYYFALNVKNQELITKAGELLGISDELNNTICKK